jgi:hypothetical protein
MTWKIVKEKTTKGAQGPQGDRTIKHFLFFERHLLGGGSHARLSPPNPFLTNCGLLHFLQVNSQEFS